MQVLSKIQHTYTFTNIYDIYIYICTVGIIIQCVQMLNHHRLHNLLLVVDVTMFQYLSDFL